MTWVDWALPTIIIVGLILIIWARVSGQTITELFRDLRDFFSEKREDIEEKTDIGIYDR